MSTVLHCNFSLRKMASDNLVAFIIGAGPNVGSAVAAKLQGGGYKVAVGSRNPKAEEGYFPVKLDIEDRKSVLSALDTVNKELGPVNVVIFITHQRTMQRVESNSISPLLFLKKAGTLIIWESSGRVVRSMPRCSGI